MPAQNLPADLDDLAEVTTAAALGAALQRLRLAAGWSLRALERQTKSSRLPLTRSTIGDIEHGKRLPRHDWLASYLAACNLSKREQRPWLRARAQLMVSPALVASGPLR